ncbi:hypothetical protein DFP72DRAFT_1094402 [Ephemerocybe angulata]|uniref:Uncharacterized protein n=1 Tax=Ephemerocybe angulata TaxID=980116 RepID=A0A8H6I9Z9_9AGAR|nr:hypothetical protein DFP72DRAFT_1094402 [Tulosesus angulatus]
MRPEIAGNIQSTFSRPIVASAVHRRAGFHGTLLSALGSAQRFIPSGNIAQSAKEKQRAGRLEADQAPNHSHQAPAGSACAPRVQSTLPKYPFTLSLRHEKETEASSIRGSLAGSTLDIVEPAKECPTFPSDAKEGISVYIRELECLQRYTGRQELLGRKVEAREKIQACRGLLPTCSSGIGSRTTSGRRFLNSAFRFSAGCFKLLGYISEGGHEYSQPETAVFPHITELAFLGGSPFVEPLGDISMPSLTKLQIITHYKSITVWDFNHQDLRNLTHLTLMSDTAVNGIDLRFILKTLRPSRTVLQNWGIVEALFRFLTVEDGRCNLPFLEAVGMSVRPNSYEPTDYEESDADGNGNGYDDSSDDDQSGVGEPEGDWSDERDSEEVSDGGWTEARKGNVPLSFNSAGSRPMISNRRAHDIIIA